MSSTDPIDAAIDSVFELAESREIREVGLERGVWETANPLVQQRRLIHCVYGAGDDNRIRAIRESSQIVTNVANAATAITVYEGIAANPDVSARVREAACRALSEVRHRAPKDIERRIQHMFQTGDGKVARRPVVAVILGALVPLCRASASRRVSRVSNHHP